MVLLPQKFELVIPALPVSHPSRRALLPAAAPAKPPSPADSQAARTQTAPVVRRAAAVDVLGRRADDLLSSGSVRRQGRKVHFVAPDGDSEDGAPSVSAARTGLLAKKPWMYVFRKQPHAPRELHPFAP